MVDSARITISRVVLFAAFGNVIRKLYGLVEPGPLQCRPAPVNLAIPQGVEFLNLPPTPYSLEKKLVVVICFDPPLSDEPPDSEQSLFLFLILRISIGSLPH